MSRHVEKPAKKLDSELPWLENRSESLWSVAILNSGYKNNLLAIVFFSNALYWTCGLFLFVKRPEGPEFNGNGQVLREKKHSNPFQCL